MSVCGMVEGGGGGRRGEGRKGVRAGVCVDRGEGDGGGVGGGCFLF